MNDQSLFQWIGLLVGGGGLGAVITYLATFKSKNRIALADAKTHEETAEQMHIESENKLEELERDRYEAMYSQINKMIEDYNTLSDEFREFRKEANEHEKDFMKKIQEQFCQLIDFKTKIKQLEKLRCYNEDCPNRIKDNPNTNINK